MWRASSAAEPRRRAGSRRAARQFPKTWVSFKRVNAPGLKLYPRRPFASQSQNSFDYPLSSRFDESDSYVIFDNVFVPWEDVFIYRNLEVTRDQWWKTPSHLYGNHQAQVRYATKLRFMIGLAKRMNEMTGNEANPVVQTVM